MFNFLWQKPKSWPRIKVILQPYSTRSCHLDCKPFHTSSSSKRSLIFTISLYFQIDYLFPYSQALQIIFPCSQHTLSLCLTNWFKSFSSSLLFNLSYNLWIYTSVPLSLLSWLTGSLLAWQYSCLFPSSAWPSHIILTLLYILIHYPCHLFPLFSCHTFLPMSLTASLACRPTHIS